VISWFGLYRPVEVSLELFRFLGEFMVGLSLLSAFSIRLCDPRVGVFVDRGCSDSRVDRRLGGI